MIANLLRKKTIETDPQVIQIMKLLDTSVKIIMLDMFKKGKDKKGILKGKWKLYQRTNRILELKNV